MYPCRALGTQRSPQSSPALWHTVRSSIREPRQGCSSRISTSLPVCSGDLGELAGGWIAGMPAPLVGHLCVVSVQWAYRSSPGGSLNSGLSVEDCKKGDLESSEREKMNFPTRSYVCSTTLDGHFRQKPGSHSLRSFTNNSSRLLHDCLDRKLLWQTSPEQVAFTKPRSCLRLTSFWSTGKIWAILSFWTQHMWPPMLCLGSLVREGWKDLNRTPPPRRHSPWERVRCWQTPLKLPCPLVQRDQDSFGSTTALSRRVAWGP